MSLAETIAYGLGGAKKTPEGYVCKCPCHDDKSASLSLAESDDYGVVLNCLAGCDWKDVRREVENLGFLKKPTKPDHTTYVNGSARAGKYDGAKFYVYKDAVQNTLCRKVKLPDKKQWQERWENGAWHSALNGMQVPLYNLKAVLASDLIYLCEGEKDAETLIMAGLPATTNHAGANSWAPHLTEQLKGKSVIIIPDNDDAGRKRITMLKKALEPVCKELRLFEPPNVPEKGDVTDWVNAGGDPNQILGLSKIIKNEETKIEILRASDWLKLEIIPQEPILHEVFDRGDKVVIIGQSKTRKSFFAQQLAYCLASGQSFIGFPALDPIKVLLIQIEIKKDRYHQRCSKMSENLAILPGDLENLFIINARGCPDVEELIKLQTIDCKPDVVIIDPFYKVLTGDENKSEDIKPVLKFFDALAEETGAAILYVHHDKKGVSGDQQLTDRGSGSGILARDFDSAIFLSPHKDSEETIVLEFVTRNYAPHSPISLDWRNYHFGLSERSVDKKTTRNSLNGPRKPLVALVELVTKAIQKEYAFGSRELDMGEFNDMLEGLGIKERKAPDVKERLLKDGWIDIVTQKAARGRSCKVVILRDRSTIIEAKEAFDSEIPF